MVMPVLSMTPLWRSGSSQRRRKLGIDQMATENDRSGVVDAVHTLEDFTQYRERILALAREHRARQIYVFGSLARDEMRAESDIDFLVDFEDGYALRDQIRLTLGLEDLLNRRVDVIDRECLREELRESILAEARPL